MIDFNLEKERTITTQEAYDIINFAVAACNDDGVMSSFIFERLVYAALAMTIYKNRFEEIKDSIETSPLGAWDMLVSDGTIELMNAEYPVDCEYIAQVGQDAFDEYAKYASSATAVISDVADTINGAINKFTNSLDGLANNEKINQVLEIADKWGMNR